MKRAVFWLTLYTACFGGSYMLYHLVLPVRISFHILALVGLVVYLFKRGLPNSPLTPAALLVPIAVGASIVLAMDKRMALENGWSWLVSILILLVLIQLCREGLAATLFQAHFVAGGLVAAFALIQFVASGARPAGLFDNINLTGAYAAALLLPALNKARERSGRARLLYSLLVVLLGLTVLMTNSRGGLLSAGVALAVYLSLSWQAAPIRKIALWLLTGMILAIPLWFLSQQPGHTAGDAVRLDLWRSAGQMIDEHPTGVGPGLFAQGYRLIGTSGENRFTGAHNQYLTLGAELGAPGLAAGAVILLALCYCLTVTSLKPSQMASCAALVGIAAHLMVDNYPGVNWTLLVSLYVAHVAYEARLPINRLALQLAGAAAALLLTLWTISMLQLDRAQMSYEIALRTGRAYDAYEATALDPDNQLYRLELQRLEGQDVSGFDSNLSMYALTMYGRPYR